MAASTKKQPMTIMLIGGLMIGLCILCACAGVAFYALSGDDEAAPVAQASEAAGQPAEEPAAQPTSRPTARPTARPAPTATPPAETAGAAGDDLYRHPSAGFSILPVSEQVDEGPNYVTFYADDGTVDVTVFDLEGDLGEENLEELAGQVLDTVLVETEWTKEYSLTGREDGQVHGGYILYFENAPTERDETQGALFLYQRNQSLFAVTLLTADYASVADGWGAIVDSFQTAAEQQAAEPSSGGAAAGGGADSGFRPDVNGFSFANYGNEENATNLTPVEMRRMFGDSVCSAIADDGECFLSPAAQKWMQKTNKDMNGGHCEGMAVLSQLMYYGAVEENNFGGQNAFDLDLYNEALQREIAYWWVTQLTYPGGVMKVNESPSAVVKTLQDGLQEGSQAREWWVIGIYERDGSGGHAVTPFAVEQTGDGLYDILIYDNNYPGEAKAIKVDANNETWEYFASINPNEPGALYEGDAETQTLEVVAITPRLAQQECPFCRGGTLGSGRGMRSLKEQQVYEIHLEGAANLLISDDQGNRLGYVDGQLVNEITGASMDTFRFGMDIWNRDYEPVYRIPVGTVFGLEITNPDAAQPITAALTVLGPGFFISIDEMEMEPAEVDLIGFANEGNFYGMVYLSDYTETPAVIMGIETEDAGYALWAQATELTGDEDTLNVGVDLDEGAFVLNSTDNQNPGTFDFHVLRIDDNGLAAFGTDGFVLEPDTTIYLDYLTWPGNGSPLQVQVDYGADGTVEETLELPDSSDEFYWE